MVETLGLFLVVSFGFHSPRIWGVGSGMFLPPAYSFLLFGGSVALPMKPIDWKKVAAEGPSP